MDVIRLRQKENGPIVRPIIVEFRSEYDKWTVMRMKAKLRECERSNCDICAVNETGLTGEEYMEVRDGYSWFSANRECTKGRSGGAGFIIKKGFDLRKW